MLPTSPSTLHTTLAQAHADYTTTHPKSLAAHRAAQSHLPGGNTRTVLHASPFPLTVASASGSILTSLDGPSYTDFLSEYTAGLFGHSHPRIRAAVESALDKGWNYGGSHAAERELARMVCERFAPAMELVRFTNSGTEANMCAIAAAKAFTRRTRGKILVFQGGYHGGTLGFADGMKDEMLLPHVWVVAPYDSLAGTKAVLQESLGSDEKLAAILVEPMQGSAGAIPASVEFLKFLRQTADEHGALLIFDEVMTSRLAWNGLGQNMGIQPDLMTLGKWVGGGMTFGAFGGWRDVMQMFDPEEGKLKHAGTYNNNVFSMAAGVAALGVYDKKAIEALNALGEHLKRGVEKVFRQNGFQNAPNTSNAGGQLQREQRMWISGRGSMLAIRIAGRDEEVRRGLFWHYMLSRGIYLAPRGFISLNLEMTQADVERFIGGVEGFLKKYGTVSSKL